MLENRYHRQLQHVTNEKQERLEELKYAESESGKGFNIILTRSKGRGQRRRNHDHQFISILTL
jgi:hypothetical protein